MRIGIIGTGTHGSRYANHVVHDVDGLELVAISRRSAEVKNQAERWQCRSYTQWQDLVASQEVEAVIAAVPPALNLEIARACAEKGKALLIEKPLAVSSAAGGEIIELCQEKNFRLTVGQTLRYNPVVQRLRQQLPEIGTLYSFSANQRLEPSTLAWHSDPEQAGAGVSFHTAVHVFDTIRFITGLEVQRVMAATRREHNPTLEDLLIVMVEMEQGVLGTIDCSKVGHARSGRYEFVGLEGQLHGDQVHNSLSFIRRTEVSSLEMSEPVTTIVPLLKEWESFLNGEGSNPVTGEDGLASVRLCEACLESSRQGSWVKLQ